MRLRLAAGLIGTWFVLVGNVSRLAAQTGAASGEWNDARALALVQLATQRRAEQLADTGLVDYHAMARGYVTFLAAMGSGFLETPKVVKTDQLALEVYWHSPNLSKQRIIGRRDTLLLPTDIQYHRDHLGIVQNNFPDFIRIGDGDEVRDVPHPLSRAGMGLYDFRLTGDSVGIQLADRKIELLEVSVRPKDDRQPRIIGAFFLDPSGGQVVRMAFNFTRAALIDHDLEDLAVVLENRLVGSRYWLPSRQEIEIRRTGTWLDFPVRAIIRGRWEVGDYDLNVALPAATFTGPEIVIAPPRELAKYPWQGAIMDSLPDDVKATVDPDIRRVLDEARVLVRAQALQRVNAVRVSAPRISDFVRFDRAEGLSLGGGGSVTVAPGVTIASHIRWGFASHLGRGGTEVRWETGSGKRLSLFYEEEDALVGDVQERSLLINSLAAQEFGSDFTDPFYRQSIGGSARALYRGLELSLRAAWEKDLWAGGADLPTPMTGSFGGLPDIDPRTSQSVSVTVFRPLGSWLGPGVLSVRFTGEARKSDPNVGFGDTRLIQGRLTTHRAAVDLEHQAQLGPVPLITTEHAAAALLRGMLFHQDLVYYGGPVTAPGYSYHSLAGTSGSTTRIETHLPIPFPSIPLGRFGTIPGAAHLAPYAGVAVLRGAVPSDFAPLRVYNGNGAYPYAGVGLLTMFDVLRFDVARGFARGGGWTFNVDVTRDFWSIL